MNALKLFIRLIALFLIAAVISWSLTGFPGLAFAAVLATMVYATYHDELKSSIFGALTGLILDFVSPELVGANAFSLSLTGFIVSYAAKFFHAYNFVWFFIAGMTSFILRTGLIFLFHLIVYGKVMITGETRGFIAAALWTGIVGSVLSIFFRRERTGASE